MKKYLSGLLVALCVVAPLSVNAQGKVAVLNVEQAIMQTSKAKAKFKSLRQQSEYASNLRKLEALKKEHDSAVKKLQKDLAVMSTERKQSEGKKIQEKRADIEFLARKLQMAEKEQIQLLMQEFGPKMEKALKQIVDQENIGLLVNRQAVIHAKSDYDITKKVTQKLNAM